MYKELTPESRAVERAVFAKAAMQGILASPNMTNPKKSQIVTDAVDMADKLMAALDRRLEAELKENAEKDIP